MRRAVLAALLSGLAGCGGFGQPPAVVPKPALDWRAVATDSDRERLREWRTAFIDALRAARTAGHSAEIAHEGALLDPDAALGGGPIPNGNYRCRVTKLGAKVSGLLDYVSYPAFNCRISQAGQLQDFAKLTGSQRQMGSIFPGDPLRRSSSARWSSVTRVAPCSTVETRSVTLPGMSNALGRTVAADPSAAHFRSVMAVMDCAFRLRGWMNCPWVPCRRQSE